RQHLKTDMANVSLHPTDKQKTTMQTRVTALQRRLDAWAHVQELYMPIMSQFHQQSSEAGVTNTMLLKPESFKLWFLSELQPTVSCDKKLAAHKWDLCRKFPRSIAMM
ncbi:uncharacterized protein EDB93DRAFT_1076403, partial [Suillus bovinus]|uniref:uncharacterized protein n=1 Tax=Suillus bovinus TaxID=48563 RepID=UPI001B87229A